MAQEGRRYVDFKRLKASVSMLDMLRRYGLLSTLKEKGSSQLVGPCPITGKGKTAFKVDTEKNAWYSFILREGGGILEFVARLENTDTIGAANLQRGLTTTLAMPAASGQTIQLRPSATAENCTRSCVRSSCVSEQRWRSSLSSSKLLAADAC